MTAQLDLLASHCKHEENYQLIIRQGRFSYTETLRKLRHTRTHTDTQKETYHEPLISRVGINAGSQDVQVSFPHPRHLQQIQFLMIATNTTATTTTATTTATTTLAE
ncbi:hypothetical protein E2C01_037379 [Portunus trituberculatus]|uniref:Uncharacterized protein n=1 Tax=Portunus trituberculatus TaxID=210409 RepID=A0A5B7FFG8_PORTR|nr:hypothetical protein [Portunus trituberculatus]